MHTHKRILNVVTSPAGGSEANERDDSRCNQGELAPNLLCASGCQHAPTYGIQLHGPPSPTVPSSHATSPSRQFLPGDLKWECEGSGSHRGG
eukprot:7484561-Pyramimonas_sp.AAC.1